MIRTEDLETLPVHYYDEAGRITQGDAWLQRLVLNQHRIAGDRVREGFARVAVHYVDVGTWETRLREPSPAQLDRLTLTITGIPAGAGIVAEGVRYPVATGVAELSFTLPGTYVVEVEETVRYLPARFEIVIP